MEKHEWPTALVRLQIYFTQSESFHLSLENPLPQSSPRHAMNNDNTTRDILSILVVQMAPVSYILSIVSFKSIN